MVSRLIEGQPSLITQPPPHPSLQKNKSNLNLNRKK